MAIYYTTPLPGVLSTPGPTWATQLNQILTLVEGHNHTGSDESQVPVAAVIFNGNIAPTITNTYSLGAPTLLWSNIYTSSFTIATLVAANPPTPLFLTGSLAPTANGISTLGTSDLLFKNIYTQVLTPQTLSGPSDGPIAITTPLIPNIDNAIDLGSPSLRFRNVYTVSGGGSSSGVLTIVNQVGTGTPYEISTTQAGSLFTNLGGNTSAAIFNLPAATGSGRYYIFLNQDLIYGLQIGRVNVMDILNFLGQPQTGSFTLISDSTYSNGLGACITIADMQAGVYVVTEYIGNWSLESI